MQSGGGVSGVCVRGGGGVILWDVCPLISLCVCARARGVCEAERGVGVVRTRCHGGKNTEIYRNSVKTVTKKEEPGSVRFDPQTEPELLFHKLRGIKL